MKTLRSPLRAAGTALALAFMPGPCVFDTAASVPLTEKYASRLTLPRSYQAHRTTGKIKIDGRLSEPDWQKAVPTEPFTDIRGDGFPEPAKQTWAKMLWDDDNLYIAARLTEDNITARLTRRDTIIWHDNDFEVFIDPDGDGVNYFEFENNARGVLFDLLLDKPYRSDGSFFIPWDCEGWTLATSFEGTLNNPRDKDRAWFVEMAIPFNSLRRDFKDPRQFKTWRLNFSRVQWTEPGKPEENWVWSPTGRIDMHMPERWGFLTFSDSPAGSDSAAKPDMPDMDAYRLLWAMFYAQLDHRASHPGYIRTLGDFILAPEDLALLPKGGELGVDASNSAFTLSLTVPGRDQVYSLDQNGKFTVSPLTPKVVKNWAWTGLHRDRTPDQWNEWFAKIHNAGISAVLFEGYDADIYRLAKENGLEAHYWKWTLNRGGELLKTHPEWYAVNRNGESAADKPAYVGYYRFLCPSRKEVRDYLAADYAEAARLPYIDGLHLDYMRLPDVILPVGLWKNYGIEQTAEHAPYDYCYCDSCRTLFKTLTGRDPLLTEFPMEDQSWVNFRLDAVTDVVEAIADSVRGNGLTLSSAVFPGPSMARKMVRQDWDKWPLDAWFPMIYNGFYNESTDWIGRSVAEGVKALAGRGPLYCGVMAPDIKGNDFTKALDQAFANGASGVSFFAGPDDTQLLQLKAYMDSHNLVPAN